MEYLALKEGNPAICCNMDDPWNKLKWSCSVKTSWSEVKLLSCVWLLATPWTVAGQAPLSMGFSRQEYWRRLPFPSPRDFPTQELNPGLRHCRRILCQLSHQASPRILEWVAYPFSSGSSWPKNQTGVSCVAGDWIFWILYQLSYQGSPVQSETS